MYKPAIPKIIKKYLATIGNYKTMQYSPKLQSLTILIPLFTSRLATLWLLYFVIIILLENSRNISNKYHHNIIKQVPYNVIRILYFIFCFKYILYSQHYTALYIPTSPNQVHPLYYLIHIILRTHKRIIKR